METPIQPAVPPQPDPPVVPIVGQVASNKLTYKSKIQHFFMKLKVLVFQSRRNQIITVAVCIALLIGISGSAFAIYTSTRHNIEPLAGVNADNDLYESNSTNNSNANNPNTVNNQQSGGSPKNTGSDSGSGNSASSGGTPAPAPQTVTFSAPIGYVGGSLTVNARDGYTELGGTKFWERIGPYGGGTIDNWAAGINPANVNSSYWNAFNKYYTKSQAIGPTKTLWLQLLGRAEKSDDGYYNDAVAVINEIKNRISGVVIYVSAMNGYSETGVCNLPANAPSQMRTVTNRLVADGKALAGPYIGDITNAQLDSGDTQCHANESGRAVLGAPLLSFFK